MKKELGGEINADLNKNQIDRVEQEIADLDFGFTITMPFHQPKELREFLNPRYMYSYRRLILNNKRGVI